MPVVKQRRGNKRGRIVKAVLVLLAAVFLMGLGKNIFSDIRGFSGTEYWGIASEEEISDELVPGKIPLYLQKDKRWKDEQYGSGTMEVTGCGPTCLSMVVCGLRRDEKWLPVKIAKKVEREGYYVSGSGSSWSLMTEGAEEFGLTVEQLPLQEGRIRRSLQGGQPIICVMGPGDFTDEGHYIVLSGEDEEGNIIVRDPNSRARSEKKWDLEQLMGQMKNLWTYSY